MTDALVLLLIVSVWSIGWLLGHQVGFLKGRRVGWYERARIEDGAPDRPPLFFHPEKFRHVRLVEKENND